MDFYSLRRYLALPPRKRPEDVMIDALHNDDDGALLLLQFIIQTRVNRRTRRCVEDAKAEFVKRVRERASWYVQLQGWVWSLYRLSLGRNSTFLLCC
jgi:hypothetical protein